MDPKRPRAGWLYVELNGPGVSTESIDGYATIRFVHAYLTVLRGVAHDLEKALVFEPGLALEDKCAAIALPVKTDGDLHHFVHLTNAFLRRDRAPTEGVQGHVEEARKALRALPQVQRARALTSEWSEDIIAPPNEQAQSTWSLTSLRATLMRVGGAMPRARFESRQEGKPFITTIESVMLAQKLALHLYREVDVEVRILRDVDGYIDDAFLLGFQPLEDSGDPTEEWREWLAKSAPQWESVDDVEKELDRGD